MRVRTPREIIGDDAFVQLVFEGYEVVPQKERNSMDKVEDIVGRLRGDDDLSTRIEAADLIQSQQAIIEEMREALEMVLSDCKCTQDQYDRNGPQWTSPTGHEYADMSYLLGKCEEISEIARKALSQKDQIDG